MTWTDDFGRPELAMHPEIVTGEADWRLEPTGRDQVDDALADRRVARVAAKLRLADRHTQNER